MKLIDLSNLSLPKKNDEIFRKVDLQELFSYNFKEFEEYKLNINSLIIVDDTKEYKNPLFKITQTLNKNQSVLTINENTQKPIYLIHKIDKDETFHTNSLKIEVKEGIKASLVEVFINSSKNSAFSVNRSFKLDKKATLEYLKIQDIDKGNSFLYNCFIEQKDESNLNFSNFEFGEGLIINSYENIIKSQNVQFYLNGLVKSCNNANTSNLIVTIHENSNSLSDINYRHSLKDKSKAVFKVKSIVKEKATFSKAFQHSKTILLSDDAVIFTQPHLEIFIDELEASHGATTGTLDKDQLLYLQARGISKEKAYNMLLKAFEAIVYENIKDEVLKQFILNYKRNDYV